MTSTLTHARNVAACSASLPPAANAPVVWPAAFTLMLVANLVAPSMGFVPKKGRSPANLAHGGDLDPTSVSTAPPGALGALAEVRVEPLKHTEVKTRYSSGDILRALGSGSAPFRNFGDSVADVYEFLTGEVVDDHARDTLAKGGLIADETTGLIPEVAILRVPSEILEVVADVLHGKSVSPDRMTGVIQNADVRTLARASGRSVQTAPHASVDKASELGPANQLLPRDIDRKVGSSRGSGSAPNENGRDPAIKVMTGEADDPTSAHFDTGGSATLRVATIVGEEDHLKGYEQQIDAQRLPSGNSGALVLIGGHHYLRGNAGYYRATRGQSGDHWLIDSPHPGRAQVPVTYDPPTGQWQAFKALRLCGGGCGSSRGATPDSIALNRHDIDAVLSHLRDDEAQNAILAAYSEVSRMKLLRTNRPDLKAFRDYTIIPNRAKIRYALEKVAADAPLFEQQRLAAFVSATHYRLNPATEAFCQENAEILFHFLIEGGLHADTIRMVTIQPEGGAPHALVLYTESDELIDALELATPTQYGGPGTDGITGDNFAGLIMGARDSTLLLDPWSRVKAVGFSAVKDPEETMRVLDMALTDIGHQPGKAYTVALTRPLGPRRTIVSRGSLESAGTLSTGTGSSDSLSNVDQSDPS